MGMIRPVCSAQRTHFNINGRCIAVNARRAPAVCIVYQAGVFINGDLGSFNNHVAISVIAVLHTFGLEEHAADTPRIAVESDQRFAFARIARDNGHGLSAVMPGVHGNDFGQIFMRVRCAI